MMLATLLMVISNGDEWNCALLLGYPILKHTNIIVGRYSSSWPFNEFPNIPGETSCFLWNTNHNTSKSPTSRFHSYQHVFFRRRSQILVHGIWMILDGLCLFILILDDPWILGPGRLVSFKPNAPTVDLYHILSIAGWRNPQCHGCHGGCPSNFLDASIQRPSKCPLWGLRTSPKWVEDTVH